MLALIKKFIDFAKYVTNRDLNGAVTQLIVWAAGVVTVALYAQTDWAESIPVAGQSLADLNGWSQIAFGLGISSVSALATDFIKARDNNDSAAMPPLIK
jgi:hypothetical protein